MTKISLGGTSVQTIGKLPEVGNDAPNFNLISTDLSEKTLADYKGSKVVLNIFPSIDTNTCASSVRMFNKKASEVQNTKIICISRDLPFTMSRFCGAEGINNLEMLSDFKTGEFGKNYGLALKNGPLEALHSRCIIVLDENGKITYTEQVKEIADEPNYKAALNALAYE